MNIISNCELCNERSLHLIGSDENNLQQCINCGYVTSKKFILKKGEKKEDNLSFKELSEDMKKWCKVKKNKIWMPMILTLPTGMIYPFDDKNKMKWGYATLVNIPINEQKNYPIPEQEGKFYTQKFDVDNAIIFDEFVYALGHLKHENEPKTEKSRSDDGQEDSKKEG